MAKLTPQQIAEKWSRNLQSSTPSITAGVNAVQENPAQKAIAQKQKLINNWNAAIQEGKWERGLGRVTLASWKQSMLEKGVQRIQAGATQGMPKMQRYVAAVQPYMDNLQATVQNMPSTTLEDSIARMTAWVRGMAEFEYDG